jgi:hypothetical protein
MYLHYRSSNKSLKKGQLLYTIKPINDKKQSSQHTINYSICSDVLHNYFMAFGPQASLDQAVSCIFMPVQKGKWNSKL